MGGREPRPTRRVRGPKSTRRFLGPGDMGTIKHDADVYNSQENRGELKRTNNRYIAICGCGVTGCAIHSSWTTRKDV